MTPEQFVRKWSDARLGERQGSQSHFNDLCDLLGEPRPTDEDGTGDTYCFEKGAEKVGGGQGWADVWRRGCFGWEYKGPRKDLGAALRQLQIYAPALENPPYLVVSDMAVIEVHTNFTNAVSDTHLFNLRDLYDPERRDLLRSVLRGEDRLRPKLDRRELTARAAKDFGDFGRRLQDRADAPDPRKVAHFLNRLIFCMFAEGADLLPKGLFTRTLQSTMRRPEAARAQLADLFAKMRTGGFFGADVIRWFNGGLFDPPGTEEAATGPADSEGVLPLAYGDLELIAKAAADHDWSQIDPSIFGTLFEEALHVTRERPALGAHYTDREKIERISGPVITAPLNAEWAQVRADIVDAVERARVADVRRAELAADLRAQTESGGGDLAGSVRDRAAAQAIRRDQQALEEEARQARTGGRNGLLAFQQRLAGFRVLDPACGSGNFLYIALHALRDIEQTAMLDGARLLGIDAPPLKVSPANLLGLEIEPYAAELARVTLWIGDLQWLIRRGYRGSLAEPILSALDQIENRDALLDVAEDASWGEAAWPDADAIVGNPPFVGGKKLRDTLGDATVERLFAVYKGRVPAEADLVCYWIAKAWAAVSASRPLSSVIPEAAQPLSGTAASPVVERAPADGGDLGGPGFPLNSGRDNTGEGRGRTVRAGLVATNSVRGGANRRVLQPIAQAGVLWDAWSDQPWTQDGAAVRVSMFCFGQGFVERRLDGRPVARINADLTAAEADLTQAKRLKQNAGVAFQGPVLVGPFQIDQELARDWLLAPRNPNGRSNSDVLRPIRNASDIMRRSEDRWLIDFNDQNEAASQLYERPFQYALIHIEPTRSRNRRAWRAEQWWKHGERGEGWRQGVSGHRRYIVTPRVARHRVFTWLPASVFPDSRLFAFTRDDDTTLGLLQSRVHELWSLGTASWHGVGNDPTYNAKSCFETFPFPDGLTPDTPAGDYAVDPRAQAIGREAEALDRLRNAWLNPADLVRTEPEVVPGYPDRILPVSEEAAKVLKARTLTNLYNQRPAWLDAAHRRLDAAVAAAYGWTDWGADGLPDEVILARLFTLNQQRAEAGL